MLLKAVGAVMMVDGVLFAAAALPTLNTFAYRSLRDQSLVVAHFIVGVLLLLSGRLVFSGRTLFLLAASSLIVALAVAGIETTRFDWLGLVLRTGYTAFALMVLFRTTFPKT